MGKFKKNKEEIITAYLCVLPWSLGLSIFIIGPIIASLIFSFMDYSVVLPPKFIGLANYKKMFFGDPLLWKSLYNTLYMTVIGVPLNIILSLSVALLLNQKVKGEAFFRTIFYLPSVVPQVAMSLLWMWILNPQVGLVNYILSLFGIKGPMWLASEQWAKPAFIIMGLWGIGGNMVIFLAGLQNIPQHLYDAATVDGANIWQRFKYVTLPMLSPTIFFVLVMGIIGTLQIFTQAYIMTAGGPMDATLFYVYHLFNKAFRDFHMGYASAMAWFLFIIIFAATMLNLKLAPKWVYYEAE
jgi:multiple sugar transport system permease protein